MCSSKPARSGRARRAYCGCVVACAVLAFLGACGKNAVDPPAPEALRKIECDLVQRPDMLVSGVTFLKHDRIVVAAPCRKPDAFKDVDKALRKGGDSPEAGVEVIVFEKLAEDGKIRISAPTAALTPGFDRRVYLVSGRIVPYDPGPFASSLTVGFDVTVPTPANFLKYVGSETSFRCVGSRERPSSCHTRVRSKSFSLTLSIQLGRPWPQDRDLTAEITEAYALAAAHVVR